jgi:hypothetical protein
VDVLASLGLGALGLIIGFRAGIHWERVGRKVDALARVESLPAEQATAASFDEPASQQPAAAAGAPAADDASRAGRQGS